MNTYAVSIVDILQKEFNASPWPGTNAPLFRLRGWTYRHVHVLVGIMEPQTARAVEPASVELNMIRDANREATKLGRILVVISSVPVHEDLRTVFEELEILFHHLPLPSTVKQVLEALLDDTREPHEPHTLDPAIAASPDDIRNAGWMVAVHNDYKLDGKFHTFWLFTKNNAAVKGEGRTDAEALNEIRKQLLL